jgi:hypothetical protein
MTPSEHLPYLVQHLKTFPHPSHQGFSTLEIFQPLDPRPVLNPTLPNCNKRIQAVYLGPMSQLKDHKSIESGERFQERESSSSSDARVAELESKRSSSRDQVQEIKSKKSSSRDQVQELEFKSSSSRA